MVELLDLVQRLEILWEAVRDYSNREFLHICDVLVTERLVNFPKVFVIMLLNSVQQLLLLLLLHLGQNLVG